MIFRLLMLLSLIIYEIIKPQWKSMINYKIEEVDQFDHDTVNSLLVGSPFSPYRNLFVSTGSEIQKFWLEKISTTAQKKTSKSFTAIQNNKNIGFAQVADLDWDSQLFGIPMCSIQELIVDENQPDKDEICNGLVSNVLDWADKHHYKFILAKTYTNNISCIHAFERFGFLLVDTLLDFAVDFRNTPFSSIPMQEKSGDVIIRMAELKDEMELESLADVAFKYHFGRYHSDPRLSKAQATKVYVKWMSSSIRGYADFFILAEIEGKIAGLSIWKKASELERKYLINVSHYSLGAIHPDFSGRGLFNLLTYEGMKLFNGKSDVVEGPTHINNYPVQRGYQRLGWKIYDARHSFHKWLS